jgi:hypothetical protein
MFRTWKEFPKTCKEKGLVGGCPSESFAKSQDGQNQQPKKTNIMYASIAVCYWHG